MDPNATLQDCIDAVGRWYRHRRACLADHTKAVATDDPEDILLSLVAAFESLDEWLARGGFLPDRWNANRSETREVRK